ncbi:MipA/OmpV family protein [Moraxella cuniculi]|uniref:MltA-interacting protein n=1 Tax=Moraxella cuniculi TaxID=34061 RepID=A0A448GXS7_9GAMM|nr:MipA/OmpV family protein [Moraxella cuniculi]VEG13565.1 MltA-interacting protein precursor [Moraxella cuniculi]
MKYSINTLLILVALLSTGSAYAKLAIDNDARLKIGANASFNATAYASKNQITLMPQAFYDNNRVYIEGAEAGIYALKDNRQQLRLGASYDGRSFSPDDADTSALRQLDKRQWSALAHASYMYITAYGGLKVKASTDLLDRHGGQTVALSHLSKFTKDAWTIYPEIGAVWQSKDYNQYYYGISPNESLRTTLPEYQATSGWSPFATVTANYQLNDKISLFANQRLELLSKTQKDSPLTDGSIDSKTRIGVNYQF